jgi:hypothetical protein
MKCPWKENKCANKCLIGVGLFCLSVLGLAVLISVVSLILRIFSGCILLNTGVTVFSVIVILITYSKCCSKRDLSCCDKEESEIKSKEDNK